MFQKGNQIIMKAIKTIPFFVVLLGLAILPLHAAQFSQGTAPQDTPSQSLQQTQLVATGQLIKIDPDNKTITIRLANNTERLFIYDENTVLRGTQDGVQGLSHGQPTTVSVQYTQDPQSGQDIASVIEILQ
jgi:hypothetical protein